VIFYISLPSLFLAICDITIIYFVTQNLCGTKASVAVRRIRLPLAIGLIAFFALFFYTLPQTIYGLLAPILMIVMTFTFIEKKTTSLSIFEKVLIWIHYYVLAHALFVPIITVANLFTTDKQIIRYATYSLGILLVLFVCQKLDLNKLLIFVLRRPPLKALIIVLAALFFAFSMTLDNLKYILEHRLFFLILFIILLVGLFYLIKRIHQSTAILPESYHDTKKLMLLLNIKAEELTDITELRVLLDESINLMDLQLPTPSEKSAATEEERFKNFVEHSVELTRRAKKSFSKIITQVHFTGNYQEINPIKSAYMLGLLLDYVLDLLTKKPIYLEINSSSACLTARISFEYKFEKEHRNLKTFLLDGDFIQSEINKNSNLLKLKSLFFAHNGDVLITREKNTKEQVDYLSVCAVFKKEGDSHG